MPCLLGIIAFMYIICPYRVRTSTFYVPDLGLHIIMKRKYSTSTIYFSRSEILNSDYIEFHTNRKGWEIIGSQWHEIYFVPPQSFYVITEENESIKICAHEFNIYEVNCILKDSFHISHVITDHSLSQSYVKAYSDSTFLEQKGVCIQTGEFFDGLYIFDADGKPLYSSY